MPIAMQGGYDPMKTFTCRELGGKCDYPVAGATDEEVKIRMMQHAMDAHRDLFDGASASDLEKMQDEIDLILKAHSVSPNPA
jgi:predicted small metal-binding protein